MAIKVREGDLEGAGGESSTEKKETARRVGGNVRKAGAGPGLRSPY